MRRFLTFATTLTLALSMLVSADLVAQTRSTNGTRSSGSSQSTRSSSTQSSRSSSSSQQSSRSSSAQSSSGSSTRSSGVQQAFSSHPATEERAARMKAAAEAYVNSKK